MKSVTLRLADSPSTSVDDQYCLFSCPRWYVYHPIWERGLLCRSLFGYPAFSLFNFFQMHEESDNSLCDVNINLWFLWIPKLSFFSCGKKVFGYPISINKVKSFVKFIKEIVYQCSKTLKYISSFSLWEHLCFFLFVKFLYKSCEGF